MATFTMIPNSISGGVNQWKNQSNGTCAATDVDNDNGNTQYCYENSNSHEVSFGFPSPSVAEGDISSITSVQIALSAAYTLGSGINTRISSRMTDIPAGINIDNGINTHSITPGGSYANYTGAVENYSTGTTNWTYADLEAIIVLLDKISDTVSRSEARVSYLFLTVSYVAAGWSQETMNGIARSNIQKINGIERSDIEKVNGV